MDLVDERVPEDIIQLFGMTTPWPKMPKKAYYEKEVAVKLAKKLFAPLFGEVIFELGYKDYVKDIEGMKTQRFDIGI